MNEKWREDVRLFINEHRYDKQNYYISEEGMADITLKYLLRYLEGLLSQCLNVSEGYCDIWYKDSHIACEQLMIAIQDISGVPNKNYKAWK